jgi:hypothetical protein
MTGEIPEAISLPIIFFSWIRQKKPEVLEALPATVSLDP